LLRNSTLFFRKQKQKQSDLYKIQNSSAVVLSFQKIRIKIKHLEEKLSKKKDFRRLTFTTTTNHRFIALMLRWGKKTRSYTVFLRALSKCKQLFDLSNQSVEKSVGKGAIEIVANEITNKTQNFPMEDLQKKSARNLVIATERVTIEKNRTSLPALYNHVGRYRGTWNRLRKNLLVFYRNPDNTHRFFIDNINVEAKTRLSESLYYNSTDLYTHLQLDPQLKEHISLCREKKISLQPFCVNKRLISRRIGLEVAGASEFLKLKQSITLKKSEMEGSLFRGLATDSTSLNLASVVSIPKISQSQTLHSNLGLLSSLKKKEQVTDLCTRTRAAHEKLVDAAQGGKKQDSNKIPSSVLLKKKYINAINYRGVHRIERIKIGINSVSRVSPSVEIRRVRIGGATYAVPYVPHNNRKEGLGIRWLLASASLKKQRSKYPSAFCLANELLSSFKNEGESTKKREQSHQIAAANRAYTRYRWW
jgi:ribosomal protein S7